MTRTWRTLLLVVALPFVAAGCLLKDRTDTWYLDPNGAVTWSVLEKDVRSDAKSAGDRQAEEAAYMSDVRMEMHPVARGFRTFGAAEIRTRILRGAVPYSVVTDGRFVNMADLGQSLIYRVGLAGSSVVVHEGTTATWTLTIRDPHSQDAPSQNDDDVNALTEGLAGLKITITDGRFLMADGFDISTDGRVATLVDDKTDAKTFEDGGLIVKRLKWTGR